MIVQNQYQQSSGTTIINGTLDINGSGSTSLDITGGTLKGSGQIDGTVNASGTAKIAPGNSPGILNTGNFVLGAGSTLEIEIGGTTPGNNANNHDQVNVTGSVTLAGSVSLISYNFYSILSGSSFVVINNDGTDAVSGTFNGLSEGATFTSNGVVYTITYVGGDGNDVVITAQSSLYIVTNTNDSGTGSLRQAILDTNANGVGFDVIQFAIAGNGPHTIQVASPLPDITGAISIDGTSEPDYAGSPVVELRGDLLGSGAKGLSFAAGSQNSSVKGLAINSFTGTLIYALNTSGLTIEGNYLGSTSMGQVTLDQMVRALSWRTLREQR